MNPIVAVLAGLALGVFGDGLSQTTRTTTSQGIRSPRNLPSAALALAGILALGAIVIPSLSWFAMAPETDLKSLSGSLVDAPGSGDSAITLRLQTSEGAYDIVVEDPSHSPQIRQLRAGDDVTALVYPFLGQYNLWELSRDRETIESYQDTYLYSSQRLEQSMTTALWLGFAASILFVVAVALRMHFGVWREPRRSIMDAGKYMGNPAGKPALPTAFEFDTPQASTSSVPTWQTGQDSAAWQSSTSPQQPVSSLAPALDQARAKHWSTKQCPQCKSSCYVFDRRCHKCGAKLPSGPFGYWFLAEALLLAAIVFAYMQAGVWGAGAMLLLGFVVERVVKNSARRNTTAGV